MTEANGHVDLGGYALGLLSATTGRFEAHLESCEVCRTELDELRAPRACSQRRTGVARRPGWSARCQRGRARSRARADPRRGRRRARARALVRRRQRSPRRPRLLLLAVAPAARRASWSCRRSSRSPNGAEATVEVRKTGIGRVIQLRTDELPILPKGDYYELWFVGPGTRRRAEPDLGRHVPSRRERTLGRHVRRRRRPRPVPGAERHRRAGRRRPAPDRARGASLLAAERLRPPSGRRAGAASAPPPARRRRSRP